MTGLLFAILLVGFLVVIAIPSVGKSLAQPDESPFPDRGRKSGDGWVYRVEVVLVPPEKTDWPESIQRQLDTVEGRDPRAELVAVTPVNGKLILFYRLPGGIR